MKNVTVYISALFLFFCHNGVTQHIYDRNESSDILKYSFQLILNDEDNIINGEATISVDVGPGTERFSLDLIGKSGDFGMEVTAVYDGANKAVYEYSHDKIVISPVVPGPDIRTFTIKYQGIAERGLVIDTTKFGQRSFFGDNWPNLARHWLPCVDHPYDKAAVEFRIIAPDHYDVVATGKKTEESNLGNGTKLTVYSEPAPVAMKVVTIGVTRFATRLLGTIDEIPISAWVYPENRLDGFSDYNVAVDVMQYFIDKIGPYSYAKLANMQAKTQWGGLENAGTIAYFENSVTGKKTVEGLIAHEIAHQWFGNSATENSWNHVWLSEGFATYFAILYQESIYGNDKRKEELLIDRQQVIDYFKKNPSPIVDNSIVEPMKVLSTNTYQKAGWVLNMLRHKLGDETFWNGIRLYYQTYRDSNVMTQDFRQVMEEVSNTDLNDFFQQWIFTMGFPQLKWGWKYQNGKVVISIRQIQGHHVFNFPLEIGIVNDEKTTVKTVVIDEDSEVIEIAFDKTPDDIILDPDTWLLFEEN